MDQHVVQALDDIFADADEEGAHHRSGNGADAAEHGGHEGLQAGHGARGGHHAGVIGEVEQRPHRSQEGANNKGDADDRIDLDAHKLTGLEVLGHGPHGHADLGVVDELHQHRHQHDGEHGGNQSDHLGGCGPDGDLLGDQGDGGVVFV